jgi:hypothetical protein
MKQQAREDHCPCCGQRWPLNRTPADARRLLRNEMLGPVGSRVLECLVRAFGSFVSSSVLAESTYIDDPDGGPENGGKSVATLVCHMRRKMRRFGLVLEARSGRNGGSRLRWAHDGDSAAPDQSEAA